MAKGIVKYLHFVQTLFSTIIQYVALMVRLMETSVRMKLLDAKLRKYCWSFKVHRGSSYIIMPHRTSSMIRKHMKVKFSSLIVREIDLSPKNLYMWLANYKVWVT